MGNRAQLISKDNVKLAPEAMFQPLMITARLQPPFLSPFEFEMSYGHGGSPTTKLIGRRSEADLTAEFDATVLNRDEEGALAFFKNLLQ